jgi:hypothetical protein
MKSFAGSRPITGAILAATLVLGPMAATPPARAASLEEMERRAADLLERLERELEAAKQERERVAEERRRLEAERERAAAPPDPETERKVGILASEVEQLKSNLAVPPTAEYKSKYGLGPAASKVYSVARGLSIGGYGEFVYGNTVSDTRGTSDRADALRLVTTSSPTGSC